MTKILKYVLEFEAANTLLMPKNSIILSVQNQRGKITMWITGDLEEEKVLKKFAVVCTGEILFLKDKKFIGTVQFDDDSFVVHVFELID